MTNGVTTGETRAQKAGTDHVRDETIPGGCTLPIWLLKRAAFAFGLVIVGLIAAWPVGYLAPNFVLLPGAIFVVGLILTGLSIGQLEKLQLEPRRHEGGSGELDNS